MVAPWVFLATNMVIQCATVDRMTCGVGVQVKRQMEQDLRERKAASAGAQVQIVDGLTIRVINITLKAVDVKQKYLQAFTSHGYPAHFPYKQKVILLFQRIEGVDVLLFIVYVQVRCRLFWLISKLTDDLCMSGGKKYTWNRPAGIRRGRPCAKQEHSVPVVPRFSSILPARRQGCGGWAGPAHTRLPRGAAGLHGSGCQAGDECDVHLELPASCCERPCLRACRLQHLPHLDHVLPSSSCSACRMLIVACYKWLVPEFTEH